MRRLIFAIPLLFLFIPGVVSAQSFSSGIATNVEIKDTDVLDGDIISSSTDGFVKTKEAYDPLIYGVVTENPGLFVEDRTLANSKAVIFSGKAKVRVSTKNGNIKSGDFITSSTTPGVGQKADKSGYIVGLALEEYTNADINAIGTILVSLNVGAGNPSVTRRESLLEVFRLGALAPVTSPVTSLRYILAMIIVIASFVLGFVFFGRAARSGIEALGRNPLASRSIMAGIITNVLLTIGLMAIGITLAYFILTI